MDISNIGEKFDGFAQKSVSHISGKKKPKLFKYQETSVKILGDIKIKTFFKFHNNDPLLKWENAQVACLITKNDEPYFKITDVYDIYNEKQIIKFRQVEIFPVLPCGEKSHIKYKCLPGQDDPWILSEVEFKDAKGKMWVEKYIPSQDESLNDFYVFPTNDKHTNIPQKDQTKVYAPYPKSENPSVNEIYFKCREEELIKWLSNNFKTASEPRYPSGLNYFNIQATDIQNFTEEETKDLFFKEG